MVVTRRNVSALTCPSCGGPVTLREGALRCRDCSETVPVVDGVPRFPVAVDHGPGVGFFDVLSPIYETPLWFPLLYRIVGGPSAPADDRAYVADLLDSAGDEVLDVACGTGRFTRYVAGEAAFAWGVDVSDGMLARARRYAERGAVDDVAFARMEADDLRFRSDTFDGVACCWALHLFPAIADALAEMNRVLEPGGRFAGATLGEDYLLALPGAREWMRRAFGAHLFDDDELRGLLLEAGFTDVELDRRGAATFFGAHG